MHQVPVAFRQTVLFGSNLSSSQVKSDTGKNKADIVKSEPPSKKIKLLHNLKVNKCHVINVMLSFCDLAGSERQAKTNSSGLRFKEAVCINQTIMQVRLCIQAKVK